MTQDGHSAEEIARRGQELYDQQIRHQVEADHHGKYLVLDVDSGAYEIGDNYLDLARGIHARRPGAPLYTVRIGYRAVGRIGRRTLLSQR
jgi:hypothetical protein